MGKLFRFYWAMFLGNLIGNGFSNNQVMLIKKFLKYLIGLTLEAATPQNRQTHSNNSPALADELFECV